MLPSRSSAYQPWEGISGVPWSTRGSTVPRSPSIRCSAARRDRSRLETLVTPRSYGRARGQQRTAREPPRDVPRVAEGTLRVSPSEDRPLAEGGSRNRRGGAESRRGMFREPPRDVPGAAEGCSGSGRGSADGGPRRIGQPPRGIGHSPRKDRPLAEGRSRNRQGGAESRRGRIGHVPRADRPRALGGSAIVRGQIGHRRRTIGHAPRTDQPPCRECRISRDR